MTLEFEQETAVRYLQQFLTFNKARGMVSECALETHLKTLSAKDASKYLSGGWVLSPKTTESSRYRYVIFVLPQLFESAEELESALSAKEIDRGFQALATFLHHVGAQPQRP